MAFLVNPFLFFYYEEREEEEGKVSRVRTHWRIIGCAKDNPLSFSENMCSLEMDSGIFYFSNYSDRPWVRRSFFFLSFILLSSSRDY